MIFSKINRHLAIALISLPSVLLAADANMDGLDDAVETNTGTYVSLSHTATNPSNPDSDTFVIPFI